MGVEINWSLGQQTPLDPFGALARGQQIGQQRATQSALSGFDPDAADGGQSTVDALVKVGALNQAAALTGMVEHRQAALQQRRYQQAVDRGDIKAAAAVNPKAATEVIGAQEAVAKQATREKLGQLAQAGDFKGMWDTASASGDPDILNSVEAFSKHVAETHDVLTQFEGPLKSLPLDQRAAYVQSQRHLLESRGVDPKEIDAVLADPNGLTNQGIDVRLQQSLSAKDQLAEHKPVVAAAGSALIDPTTGEVVAKVPDKPDKPHATAVPGVTDANGNPVFYDSNATPEEAARQARGGGGPNPTLTEQHMQGVLGQILPGAVITSGARSPEHNAEVGGVPNSLHIAGEAMDFKKPPGETLDSIRQKLEAHNMPITELIDEGTHVHWAWGAKADAAGASGRPAAAIDNTLTGEAYLKQLDPTMQARVKAVVDGRMAVPGGGRPNPYWQAVVNNAVQYDPNFNASDYNSRAKTRADFTSGKSAQNVTALKTALLHVDSFDKSIDKLENLELPLNNKAAHFIADATGTNKRFADFRTDRLAVATELTRALRGTAGAEADIQAWLKNADETQNPAYLHEITNNLVTSLLKKRLDSLQDQYNTGMGRASDGLAAVNPQAAEVMVRISKRAPLEVNTPEEAMKLPPGTHFLTPDGKVKVRP